MFEVCACGFCVFLCSSVQLGVVFCIHLVSLMEELHYQMCNLCDIKFSYINCIGPNSHFQNKYASRTDCIISFSHPNNPLKRVVVSTSFKESESNCGLESKFDVDLHGYANLNMKVCFKPWDSRCTGVYHVKGIPALFGFSAQLGAAVLETMSAVSWAAVITLTLRHVSAEPMALGLLLLRVLDSIC